MIDPREYVAAETLQDGLAVTIRALRPDDRARVARAVRGLDRESIYFRLFSYRKELTEEGFDRILSFDPQGGDRASRDRGRRRPSVHVSMTLPGASD